MFPARTLVLFSFFVMTKKAVFGLNARIFRAQGRNGVLWELSEFTLGPMGGSYDVLLRRPALGTKCKCLVWTPRHYNRSVADNFTACLQYSFDI